MSEVIGWYTSKSEERHKSGEYAGHNETWRTDAAEVELRWSKDRRWILGSIPATRLTYEFVNRIGACRSTDYNEDPVKGFIHIQWSVYDVARMVASGAVKLAPGYEIYEVGGKYADGRPVAKLREAGRDPVMLTHAGEYSHGFGESSWKTWALELYEAKRGNRNSFTSLWVSAGRLDLTVSEYDPNWIW